MGAIGGLFGLGGKGDAPQLAQLDQPTNYAQVNHLYYQNQNALNQQEGLLSALQGQNGLQNQSSVFNQLQGIANGTGPNPAQAMLNQQTGQNVSNQAALMAGQRGANANVGLMARQAAMQGGNLQQQAIGQGATMQANQSMNAINAMGNMANQQVANQIGATQNFGSMTNAEQANLLNAMSQYNQSKVANQASMNSANAQLGGEQIKGMAGLIGGAANAMGGGASMLGGGGPQSISQLMPGQGPTAPGSAFGIGSLAKASGGMVNGYSNGGPVSSFGKFLSGQTMASGGAVDVVLSPGEKVVAPENVQQAAGGNVIAKTVPGTPKVSGDSLKNDTYKTKLPEGSVVIKRTKSGNEKDAASFVRNVLAKRGRK